MQFSRYIKMRASHPDRLSSVITYTNLFVYLITGETSYHNSTALLIGLAAISCCSSLPVSIPEDSARPFRALVGWRFRFMILKLPSDFCLSSFLTWRPPALPHRLQCSTIGRLGLNHRVRDGYGCFPQAHRHQELL